MDVIHEIISKSAIGPSSAWVKRLILAVFTSIVITLFVMLIFMIANAGSLTFTYGY